MTKKKYVPNRIARGDRIVLTVSALLLFAYGTFCSIANHFYLPIHVTRGARTGGIHLYDNAAGLMYGAVLCACLIMASIVVDHYDQRPNERHYRTFATVMMYLGFCLFLLSVFAWLSTSG